MDAYTGTKAVNAQQAFDLAALQAHLGSHLEGFAGPLRVEQFKGGQSNPTYKLVTPQRSYVMRSKPAPQALLLPSAHAIEREFAVMQALAGSDVPVPRMLLLCEDEAVLGRAFYVMAFVEGRVLWNQALPDLPNAERSAVYDEMNRVIAALHRVDFAARGLAAYGKPGNYFERQIARWTRQYQASVTEPIEAMDRLIEWLPAHVPDSARDASQTGIVHGDYRLDNLVFHPSEPRVLAVLDWELSTLGHPLADFSYHCMSWHIPPGAFRGIGGLDLAALGIPSEAEYIRRYCARTGRADPDALVTDWGFYLAYNLFRMAGILQGIAKRVGRWHRGERAGPPSRRGRTAAGRDGLGDRAAAPLKRRPVPKETTMDFDHSPRTRELQSRVTAFMDRHVYPAEPAYGPRSRPTPVRASAGRRWR